MFAFLAYKESCGLYGATDTLCRMAKSIGIPDPATNSIEFSGFRIDWFDTSDEIQFSQDGTRCLLLLGQLLNPRAPKGRECLADNGWAYLLSGV